MKNDGKIILLRKVRHVFFKLKNFRLLEYLSKLMMWT